MKLSELIRIGSVGKKQCIQQYAMIDENNELAVCALGAGIYGLREHLKSKSLCLDNVVDLIEFSDLKYNNKLDLSKDICCDIAKQGNITRITTMVMHKNDIHTYSFDEIVLWLESIGS